MDEDWISAFGALVVLLGIAALVILLAALYFLAIIWALNYIFKSSIGYFDLWAWLAIFILTVKLKVS